MIQLKIGIKLNKKQTCIKIQIGEINKQAFNARWGKGI